MAAPDMQALVEQWDGEVVLTTYDRDTRTWVFIAIHDTTLGPAMGGCRVWQYPTPADGLRDAMRLAEGMTHKWAAIGFDLGGGKSVLAVPQPLEGDARRELLRRFGRLVSSLRGAYQCGPDLGTTPDDMAVIGEETEHVHGFDRANRQPVDPGPFTALGVFVGMRAALQRELGSATFEDRTVLVQGIGDVGVPLARQLAEAGATLVLSDTVHDRAARLAAELGARTVPAEQIPVTPCDVYAPCAVGGVLNAATIPLLDCRIVAGSANNQLGEPDDAELLHRRGILYAPDYVINAGGATALPLLGRGHARQEILARIRAFERTLSEIFAEAAASDESPQHVARRRVDRVLAARRRSRT